MRKLNTEYKKLVRTVLDEGYVVEGRNGKTLQIPFYSFTIDDMENDHLLTLRKMYTKGIEGEFNTLVSPIRLENVRQFERNECNYWKKWAGPDGELNLDYWNELHPALEDLIYNMRRDPYSRRHVISLWNNRRLTKEGLKEISLPCCWHNMTFIVEKDRLHMVWTQRSVDVFYGLPSDIYLAYLFMNHIRDNINLYFTDSLKTASCMFSLANVHIYEEHIPCAKELLGRSAMDDEEKLPCEGVKA